jgi:hypothetical protein
MLVFNAKRLVKSGAFALLLIYNQHVSTELQLEWSRSINQMPVFLRPAPQSVYGGEMPRASSSLEYIIRRDIAVNEVFCSTYLEGG